MTEKLSTKTKILYGIADSGIALLTAAIQFFLLFFRQLLYLIAGSATASCKFFGTVST